MGLGVYGLIAMTLQENGYKKTIRMGPTYRYVHTDCGRKAKKINLKNSHCFYCENCEETISKHMAIYSIDKVRTN